MEGLEISEWLSHPTFRGGFVSRQGLPWYEIRLFLTPTHIEYQIWEAILSPIRDPGVAIIPSGMPSLEISPSPLLVRGTRRACKFLSLVCLKWAALGRRIPPLADG